MQDHERIIIKQLWRSTLEKGEISPGICFDFANGIKPTLIKESHVQKETINFRELTEIQSSVYILCYVEHCAQLFPPLQAPPAVPGMCLHSSVQCTHPRAWNQLIWALITSQQPSSKWEQKTHEKPGRGSASLQHVDVVLKSREKKSSLGHIYISLAPSRRQMCNHHASLQYSVVSLLLYFSSNFFFPFILMYSPSSWVEHISALHSHLSMKKTGIRLHMS